MKRLLTKVSVDEDTVLIYEGGFVDGVKAAEAYFEGLQGWGVSMHFPLFKLEDFEQNQVQVRAFLHLAKEKLGMEVEPCNTYFTHN
ncbi:MULTISPECIES: hypothetical protein [Vibrio]|uniref:hypothetical protein n=1 Tax=Vibrio TaxID=662 RepID=UPI000C864D96|nr:MULTISPECIES: hypothetical protein [Vibrio]PMI93957.1 hypothetical protein BCU33_21885 [Vibrio lentus]PTP95696.1 hypothetical protein CWO02_02265 [Vibrio splendidus]